VSEALNDKQTQVSKKVIKRLINLYVIQGNKYLVQKDDGSYGQGKKRLTDNMLLDHLEGKYTVGIFSGIAYTKIICFDVDFEDLQMAKWITYKITHQLDSVGIFDYYISFSGNKGYHIDIFIENLITLDAAIKFFQLICDKAEVDGYNGKVEFRATDKLGVKLPIGKHQKTGKFCGFCKVENGLKVMTQKQSYNHLFFINKINNDAIYNVISVEKDSRPNKKVPSKKQVINTEQAISKHNELEIYNRSEDDNIDEAIDLLTNGIKHKGSRHISMLKIAKYLKYIGLEQQEALNHINEWTNRLSRELYNTPIDECYSENKRAIQWVYDNNVSFRPKVKNVKVTLEEINAIIFKCPEKNQKLLTYALLIHSKMYATKDGTFYMTYEQMSEATGIGFNTAIRQIEKLEELEVIEIVQRNKKQKGTYKKASNKYKITIKNTNIESKVYITNNYNDFTECLNSYYSNDELKEMLPRRQYQQFIKK
jgi:hypothetical protein